MAQTTAQRQAAYRLRHLKNPDGQATRLNLLVDSSVKMALERLAVCYGVTQRAALERLVLQAQGVALDAVATIPGGQDAYYDKRLTEPLVMPYRDGSEVVPFDPP